MYASDQLKKSAVSITLALSVISNTAFAANTSFVDVPTSHWAHASITEMADRGIVTGVGNNKFAPSNSVTYAQFLTMLTREFYNAPSTAPSGGEWYSEYMQIAEKNGLTSGLLHCSPNSPINRFEMAQVLHNVLKSQNISFSSASTSTIKDWSSIPSTYQTAVSACYSIKLLQGMDDGSFSGQNTMNRAQAATVIDRLIDADSKTSAGQNIPADARYLTGDDITRWCSDKSYYKDGTFYLICDNITSKGADIWFKNPGYNYITFTVTVHEMSHGVTVGGIDGITADGRLNVAWPNSLQPETTETYTVDISGIRTVALATPSGSYSDSEVYNIYFHN